MTRPKSNNAQRITAFLKILAFPILLLTFYFSFISEIKDFLNLGNKPHDLDAESAYREAGNTFYEKELYNDALNEFSKAINHNPNNGETYRDRGFTYYHLGKENKKNYLLAIKDFDEALRINPSDMNANKGRGNTYYNLGKEDKENYTLAIKDFDHFILVNKEDASAYKSRGNCNSKKKNMMKL